MENVIDAIKSNDINQVKNLLVTRREVFRELGIDNMMKLVNDAEMLRIILTALDEYFCKSYGTYQLHILNRAISTGKDVKIIEVILNLDKDVINHRNPTSLTPLLTAVIWNRELSLIKFLLENNVGVNICNIRGEGPLHYAEKLDVLKLLIENGANVNCVDKEGFTPIMTAISYKRDREIILEFMKSGAELEIRNYLGQTCLHLALKFKNDEDIINLICCNTRDYNVEDNRGLTPLCYALDDSDFNLFINQNNNPYRTDFLYELINKGFVVNTKVFMYALEHCDNVDLIKSLLKYVDVECVDEDGNCVLHHAKHGRLIKLFARRGVPINHKNNEGITPLMYAITNHRSVEVIKSLLHWGSDVKELDVKTIFDHDKLFFEDSVCYFLFSYGMSVRLKNNIIERFLSSTLNCRAAHETSQDDCGRGVLGHILLTYPNIKVREDKDMNVNLYNLIKNFNSELNRMKQEIFIDNISYYNFYMKQYKSIRSPFLNKGFQTSDCKNIKKLFPNLHLQVVAKIQLNIKINKRRALLRKLMSVSLSKRRAKENSSDQDEDSSCEYAKLDFDSMYCLGFYMNDREIDCLLATALDD